ncbi:hypothetical protein PMAYCL1PPCAC_27014, partial [Pristionchus mayeri]
MYQLPLHLLQMGNGFSHTDNRIYDYRDQSTTINDHRKFAGNSTHNETHFHGPVYYNDIQIAIAHDGTNSELPISRLAEIIRSAGPDGIGHLADVFQLDSGKKQSAFSAARNGDATRAGQIMLEAGREKMRESTRKLSADAGGRKSLKSVHGSFVNAPEPGTEVRLAHGSAGHLANWYIEDWGAKVVLKARGGPNKPGRFLQAHANGRVDLSYKNPHDWVNQMWKPFQNGDGSWSLLSVHGGWLSARQDGSLCTVGNCDEWEHFWL